jgi:hypothetical protein
VVDSTRSIKSVAHVHFIPLGLALLNCEQVVVTGIDCVEVPWRFGATLGLPTYDFSSIGLDTNSRYASIVGTRVVHVTSDVIVCSVKS